jgi:hypothetical protein
MRRAPTPALTAGVVLLSLALGGCAHRSMPGGPEQPGRDAPVSIEVTNHNWSDVVIYLDRGNLSERLGMVTSQNTAFFTVPFLHLGPTGTARLRADPVGNMQSFSSEFLQVQPGQTIRWTLENDIERSFLGVY